jgi:hypothetical protein
MLFHVLVKSIGNRRPILETKTIELPDNIKTPEELIEQIVRLDVRRYNEIDTDSPLLKYLTDPEIEDQAAVGKIGFNDRKNSQNQDEEKAVRQALQAFEDGLFLLLVNSTAAKVGEKIKLQSGDALIFIRLSLLAGSRF